MAKQICLFRTSNKDSARLFIDAVKALGMDAFSESKENGEFYCELITVIDNSYSMQHYAKICAYADAYWMELLKVNGQAIKHD